MTKKGIEVIQATAWYPPHDLGGTEVYLESLVDGLAKLGTPSRVIVPRHSDAAARYVHRGAEVTTYPVNPEVSSAEMRAGLKHHGFDEFYAWLNVQERCVYHQHSWTRGCGSHHLRAARELGFKTVLTIHVPTNVCLRGTMMRFGKRACDGRIVSGKCGRCWAQSRGVPRILAPVSTSLPAALGERAVSVLGRAGMMLSARALANEKLRQLHAMAANADIVIPVCQWLYDALVRNGLPTEKLRLNRQGIAADFGDVAPGAASATNRDERGKLRILYIGRWDPVKGVDVVVKAMAKVPMEAPVTLSIRAISSASNGEYEENVRKIAESDPRITISSPVARTDLAQIFAEHDVLAVPSTWMETGPLVVLEAQAAGLFVMGSRLGGIAELVEEGENGLLLPANDIRAWSAAIEKLVTRFVGGQLQYKRRQVRSMSTVAEEMNAIYRELLA